MWKFLPYDGKIPPWGGIPPRLGTAALVIVSCEKCLNISEVNEVKNSSGLCYIIKLTS